MLFTARVCVRVCVCVPHFNGHQCVQSRQQQRAQYGWSTASGRQGESLLLLVLKFMNFSARLGAGSVACGPQQPVKPNFREREGEMEKERESGGACLTACLHSIYGAARKGNPNSFSFCRNITTLSTSATCWPAAAWHAIKCVMLVQFYYCILGNNFLHVA